MCDEQRSGEPVTCYTGTMGNSPMHVTLGNLTTADRIVRSLKLPEAFPVLFVGLLVDVW